MTQWNSDIIFLFLFSFFGLLLLLLPPFFCLSSWLRTDTCNMTEFWGYLLRWICGIMALKAPVVVQVYKNEKKKWKKRKNPFLDLSQNCIVSAPASSCIYIRKKKKHKVITFSWQHIWTVKRRRQAVESDGRQQIETIRKKCWTGYRWDWICFFVDSKLYLFGLYYMTMKGLWQFISFLIKIWKITTECLIFK